MAVSLAHSSGLAIRSRPFLGSGFDILAGINGQSEAVGIIMGLTIGEAKYAQRPSRMKRHHPLIHYRAFWFGAAIDPVEQLCSYPYESSFLVLVKLLGL